jgi:2-dehydro-3-deoxygluconokinase
MTTVVTFGESLLRLAPPGFERFLQSPHFTATFGGAEANVAVALAAFGMDAAYVTVLPENNPIADAAIAELRRFGVDTSRIVRGKGRLGIYYMEPGASHRPARVVYDREHSAMALAGPGDIDWESALHGARWFHITGITPAISASAADLALESMRKARAKGLAVSCDLNYRQNLWKWGKSATDVMREMIGAADILIANEEHLQNVLGLERTTEPRLLIEKVFDIYSDLKGVAVTLRESSGWAACLHDRDEFVMSRRYEITHTVDRIGSGDAFAAGLIYGWTHLSNHREALDFAVAASCLKHSIPGDFSRSTVEEVNALRHGGDAGRIQR